MDAFDRFCLYLDDLEGREKISAAQNPYTLPDRDFAVSVRNKKAHRRAFPLVDAASVHRAANAMWSKKASAFIPSPIVQQARTKIAAAARSVGLSVPGEYEETDGVRVEWGDIESIPHRLLEKTSAPREEGEPLAQWFFAGSNSTVKVSNHFDLRRSEEYYGKYRDEMSPLDAFRWVEGLTDVYALTSLEKSSSLDKVSSAMIRDAYLVPNPDGPTYLRSMAASLPDLEKGAVEEMADEFERVIKVASPDRREKCAQIAQAVQDVFDSVGQDIENPSSFLALAGENVMTFSNVKVSEADPVIYTDHTYTLRKSDIESIPSMPIDTLHRFVPEDGVEDLIETPVPVFESLPAPIQRLLASVIHKHRLEKGMTNDYGRI